MAITKIADVIQPTVFTSYTQQKTVEKSALIQSGIVNADAEFSALAAGPNTLIEMPFWNDPDGDSEAIEEDKALTPANIGTDQDRAKKNARAKSWGANGLSALLSGDDPMGAIANLVASYWVREEQKILLQTLNGVFASASMSGHIHVISALTGGKELLAGETIVDATQKLGDAKEILTGIMMHSAVEAYLVKQKLIEYVEQGVNEYGLPIKVPFFMGKRVIVDDAMAFDPITGIAETYLFGAGAIAYGKGKHKNIVEVEVARDSMQSAGEDYLINRNIFIMHPRGIKWTDTAVAKTFPTNAELATGTNWDLVYDPKKIRVVKHKFKITL